MSVVRKLTKVGEQVLMASSADDVTSLKLQRVMPLMKGEQVGGVRATVEAVMVALISAILVLKKAEKLLQSSGEAAGGPVLEELRRRLIVENKVLGLLLPLSIIDE